MKNLKTLFFTICLLSLSFFVKAQSDFKLPDIHIWNSLSIGKQSAATTNPAAWLEIGLPGTTRGFILPRTGHATIATAEGNLVYDTDTKSLWFNDGTDWNELKTIKEAFVEAAFNNVTRVLTFTTYDEQTYTVTINPQTLSLVGNALTISSGNSVFFTTSNVNEGSNLYFTNARVQAFGDTRYIINQSTSAQSASFWVSGIGRINNLGVAVATVPNYPLEVGTLPSTLNVSARFLGTVKGADAVANDEFVTLSQLSSGFIKNLYSLTTPQTGSSTINGTHFIIDGTIDLTTISNTVGTGATVSTLPKFLIARTVDSTLNVNDHAFADNTIFQKNINNVAYNSYDAWARMNGNKNYSLFCSFQSRPQYNTIGTTTNHYGLFDIITINAGTVTNRNGVYIANPVGSGTITNNYGIFIADQTKGTNNYSIYTGTTQSRFGGNVIILGNTLLNTSTDNGFGEKLQVNGRADGLRAIRGSNFVTKDQLDSVGNKIDILLPDDLYAIEGVEYNIYNKEVVRVGYGFNNLRFDFNCSKGIQYEDRYTLTPVAADSGTYTLDLNIYYQSILIATKSTNLHVTKRSAGTGTRNIIAIGDSQIQSGAVVDTIKTDYGSDAMILNFTGTQQTIGGNFMEGRRGWTWDDYTTVGRTFYKFVTTGVTVRPVLNSVYTHNGSTYTIQEVNFVNGQSFVSAIKSAGTNDPTASGTLTKTSGNGDATISFTSYTLGTGNPFWNQVAGRMDIASYLTTNGITLNANDWWTIELGTNDLNNITSDTVALNTAITNALIKADTMINAIRAASPNTRIGLIINTFEGSQDGAGNTNLTGIPAWRHGDNLRKYSVAVLNKYNNSTYRTNNIFVLATNAGLDTKNNMTTTIKKINARNPETQIVQNDYLHPANIGYAQISDVYYGLFKWFK